MNYFLLISYALILYFGLETRTLSKADDSPGFFVKIAKNVPRLGRRSDRIFSPGFWRTYKAIPRIGRNAERVASANSLTNWLETPFMVKIAKRFPPSSLSSTFADKDLTLVQPVNTATLKELIDTQTIVKENVKFIHWKDFDKALQMDSELFGKISSIGRKPDEHLKEDFSQDNFTPIIKNMVDTDGTDFVLYSQDQERGFYAPEFVRYNIM
ncbi:uncharacterized protein [Musca autumnalis]|uniref:uncharacterized protein n=1 Tax=Musca autumnalis TaxID=221902 RepID=UPI003CF3E768